MQREKGKERTRTDIYETEWSTHNMYVCAQCTVYSAHTNNLRLELELSVEKVSRKKLKRRRKRRKKGKGADASVISLLPYLSQHPKTEHRTKVKRQARVY